MSNDNPLDGGGSGYPTFKFVAIGDEVDGVVISDGLSEVATPKLQGEGTQNNVVYEIQTDTPVTCIGDPNKGDEPVTSEFWTIWIKKPSQPFVELRNKVKAAGATRIEKGDRIKRRLTRVEKPSKSGLNGQKIFGFKFTKGAASDALGEDDLA